MRHRAALFVLGGIGPLVAGVFIGAIFLLTPLPTMNELGGPVGWCGPGATSDNAIQVLLNPAVVNESGGLSQNDDYAAQMAFRSFCVGEARTRVTYFVISDLAGAILGVGLCGVIALTEQRRPPNPPLPSKIPATYLPG